MAGPGDFDFMAVGSRGIPTFQLGVDGSVCSRDQHPTGFGFPRNCGDDCFEIVTEVEDLRSRHESSLFGGQVGCEVRMKLSGIDISEAVRCIFDRARLAQIIWNALSVVSLIFSGIGRVAAMYTKPTTDGSVPASVITAPP